jgi:predicted transcriptional regulator
MVRCESIGKYVMPIFRSLVAKELVNTYKLTQVETAKRLGTTQAAISQYINLKRALKGTEEFCNDMPKIQAIAEDTARRLSNREIGPEDIALNLCKLCPAFCKGKNTKITHDFSI